MVIDTASTYLPLIMHAPLLPFNRLGMLHTQSASNLLLLFGQNSRLSRLFPATITRLTILHLGTVILRRLLRVVSLLGVPFSFLPCLALSVLSVLLRPLHALLIDHVSSGGRAGPILATGGSRCVH